MYHEMRIDKFTATNLSIFILPAALKQPAEHGLFCKYYPPSLTLSWHLFLAALKSKCIESVTALRKSSAGRQYLKKDVEIKHLLRHCWLLSLVVYSAFLPRLFFAGPFGIHTASSA